MARKKTPREVQLKFASPGTGPFKLVRTDLKERFDATEIVTREQEFRAKYGMCPPRVPMEAGMCGFQRPLIGLTEVRRTQKQLIEAIARYEQYLWDVESVLKYHFDTATAISLNIRVVQT